MDRAIYNNVSFLGFAILAKLSGGSDYALIYMVLATITGCAAVFYYITDDHA